MARVLLLLSSARLCACALPALQEDDPQTLSQMLQWSLEHQDLDALHAKAEAIRRRAAVGELEPAQQAALPAGDGGGPRIRQVLSEPADPLAAALRQAELADMWSTMMPDMVAVMRDALARATAPDPLPGDEGAAALDALAAELAALPPSEAARIPAATAPPSACRLRALWQLEELVGDLDLARDFAKIGGFGALLPLLEQASAPSLDATRVREAAVWVFGTAAQNHPEVQAALVGAGVPAALVSILLQATPLAGGGSRQAEAALAEAHAAVHAALRSKALFALSAISRSSADGARALLASNGVQALAAAASDLDERLARKALTLVADLSRLAAEEEPAVAAPMREALLLNSSSLCAAVGAHLARAAAQGDLDGSEKALDAAWAFFDLGRAAARQEPWECASSLERALRAVGGRAEAESGGLDGRGESARLGVEAAEPDASSLELELDSADGGRAELWARLGASARQLESAAGGVGR